MHQRNTTCSAIHPSGDERKPSSKANKSCRTLTNLSIAQPETEYRAKRNNISDQLQSLWHTARTAGTAEPKSTCMPQQSVPMIRIGMEKPHMQHRSSNRPGRGCESDGGAHAVAMGNREGGERSRPGPWTRWGARSMPAASRMALFVMSP
jgi:hypothetical protein